MLLFGGVADDEALESSTFFNDVYACCAARVAVVVMVVIDSYVVCVCDSVRRYVLKLERMQWHQVIPPPLSRLEKM